MMEEPGDVEVETGREGPAGRAARSSSGRSEPASRPLLAAMGQLGLRLTGLLSPRAAHAVGGVLGGCYSRLPSGERHAARVNLKLCFPELEPVERRRLRRASFQHTARYFLELGRIWSSGAPGLPGTVRTVQGGEQLEQALAGGRGALVLMPNLGNWEVAGLQLARTHALTCLYRRPRVLEMDAVYQRGRTRHGAALLPAGASGVRGLLRCLQKGEIASLLPDQDPGRGNGVFAPFFGHPANTGTLASRLAARSGAPVLTACAHRLPGGRFDVYFRMVEPAVADDDPVASAAAVNRAVEACVRAAPEQYLWSYKRFRFQPDRAPSPYKLPELARGD
jgi:KDO2-lipid IV(A) lauroyltransferase